MSITKLNYNQTNVVAGGYISQEVERTVGYLTEIFANGHPFFRERDVGQCINMATTKYGVTLCLPARKPSGCSYETWGRLHDLAEEMSRC